MKGMDLRANHHGGRRPLRRLLAIITPIALVTGVTLAVTPAIAMAATPAAASASSNFKWACGESFKPGKLNCMVIKNTSVHPSAETVQPDAIPSGDGYGPSQFQAAYGLTSASASDGAGTTVAVVDAYNDPTAASDLAAYRSAAGLPGLDVWPVHPVQPDRRDLAAARHGPDQ